MTEKQIDAAFNSPRNLFVTGPAGTGKSYRLRKYISEWENVLICAPTGIAALNLGGDTAHKIFHIPVPAYEGPSFAKNKKGAITKAMLNLIAEADTIVIDEISMFKNSDFAFAIKVIRKAEKVKGKKIRIIVSGDYSQLPPVVKKTELKLMKKFGFHESGFAFTTPEWKSLNFKVVELTEVKRQDDIEFVTELNKVRIGDCSNVDYFNQFVNENPDYSDAICICGTNSEAERINREYLDGLDGQLAAFQSEKSGRCSSGIVDDIIIVKEGARVIFTSNDMIYNRYKNGSFGVIKKFNPKSVTVEIGGKDFDIFQQDYHLYSYSVSGGHLNKKEIGVIKQYPFKLGKAITIHKSQGQTFDKVILSPDIFAAGQLYVALSRVKGPDGLSILKPITSDDLIIDDVVKKFYDDGYKFEIKKKPVKRKTTTTTTTSKSKSKTVKTVKTKKSTASKSKTKSNVKKTQKPKISTKRKTTKKSTKKG